MCKDVFDRRPELRVNTFISEMAAQFRQSAVNKASSCSVQKYANSGGDVLCDICTGTKLKALKSCLVCLASYCETHLEPHHRIPGLKRHKVIDPVENLEERICKKHDRPFELYCKTDHTCVCLFCTESDHKPHVFTSVVEEYKVKKAELEKVEDEIQQMIQERQLKIQEIKQSVKLSQEDADRETAESVEIFTVLIQSVQRDWMEVRVHSSYEGTLRRAVVQLEETLSKQMKKLCADTELKRVQQYAVDVTLDPDTASPYLVLSDDEKQVKSVVIEKNIPDNPKRFSMCNGVLGKQGFCSGRFYFEVQVKDKTEWDLGVASELVNRKGKIKLSPKNGFWTVWLRHGTEYKALAGPGVPLSLKSKPQKVGVFVDYEKGLVSFHDAGTAALIYSFTGCNFTEKLLPYFSPCGIAGGRNAAPLILLPLPLP
ncbi:Nuclear factor 7, ovary [Collichthys lucidus]|uniref:Nuclear factor 7, ovary n=1 Tax=Collichthys lucidus TaxID=240159 RepID=A0A4V6AT67_COLLU|nr:Nuclear factor 7, ovary [Collichthys lucidus]